MSHHHKSSNRLAIQPKAEGRGAPGKSEGVHRAAESGLAGGSGPLPFADRIQQSFGTFDVGGIRAHTDSAAQRANESMGSMAYATGNSVAFRGGPDLFTAAHEAAHVIQQQAGVQLRGGVGEPGDRYERHADEVASRVVQGQSAEDLLAPFATTGGTASDSRIQRRHRSQEPGAFVQFNGQTPAPPPPTSTSTLESTVSRQSNAELESSSTGAQAPGTSRIPAPPATLTSAQLVALTPAEIRSYLDARSADHAHLGALRADAAFLRHLEGLPAADLTAVALGFILRCPNSVIDRAGARVEALRILSTQLRDRTVTMNLIRNNVVVVIVPRNMLMTDLPEFAAQRNTFTFDGRPWDTTRGLGGRNTSVTEENLLGLEGVSGVEGRRGWDGQQSMEAARRNNPNAMPEEGGAGVRMHNAGVYCSGYSTTNHEFFHTIHQYGLTSADNQLISSEYQRKRTHVTTMNSGVEIESETAPTLYDTPWADGIRRNLQGQPRDNYASSTVYEYFAQTGCAFQGTNAGTDGETGRPRNNGRGWVEANEPRLAGLLGRVCSDETLRDVNPIDARRAAAAASRTPPAPQPGNTPTPAPGNSPTPGPGNTPAPPPAPNTAGQTVGDVAPAEARVGNNAVGGIMQR